jgi:hypothetical protein
MRRGGVGIVGASGTGTQEVSCIIDALGEGVSHAIGVGGRDLSEEVGGIMALEAIKLLANDPETKVLAIISKPPAQAVAGKVRDAVKASGKPAVLIFMGHRAEADGDRAVTDGPQYAATLEEGAAKAVSLLRKKEWAAKAFPREKIERRKFGAGQKHIRGLYTGGTLASEAKFILGENGITDFSILDLGDDEYTRGAVHPMIDPGLRSMMAKDAAKDPTVAILLCDVVIGYGSHANPAGELAKAVSGSGKCVLASVTGTDADPQNKSGQERILLEAGITVFPSNQYAAEAACKLIKGEE